jgi:hypothetical protein
LSAAGLFQRIATGNQARGLNDPGGTLDLVGDDRQCLTVIVRRRRQKLLAIQTAALEQFVKQAPGLLRIASGQQFRPCRLNAGAGDAGPTR